MLLFQASAGDATTSMVLNELRKYCPMLEYLHFFRENGSGATERYGDDVDGTFANRAVGSAFGTQDLVPGYGTFALKIIGKTVRLDVAYEERGGDVPSEFQVKLRNWAMNGGRNLLSRLVNDSSATSNQFNGLRRIIADLVAAGDSSRVLSPWTNGLQVVLGNDNASRIAQQKFVEAIDLLVESVDGGADCILMDAQLLTRLSSVARDHCSISLNEWGAKVGEYNGIPIVPTSRNFDGSRIIPFTETVGSSTDCTSVFAFKSSEKADLTCMTTPVGFKVYPMQKNGNFYEVMTQLQMDMAPLAKRCVAQLKGVRLG
jgi:hypothetical protein